MHFKFRPYYSKPLAWGQLASIVLNTIALGCLFYAHLHGSHWNESRSKNYDDVNWRRRALFYVIAYENKELHLLELSTSEFDQYFNLLKSSKDEIQEYELIETELEFFALILTALALPVLVVHLALCFFIKRTYYRRYVNFGLNLFAALLFLGAFFLELNSLIKNKNRTGELHHVAEEYLYEVKNVSLDLPLHHVCQRKAYSKLRYEKFPYVVESEMCPKTELKFGVLGILSLSIIVTFLLCCLICFCIYPQMGTEDTNLEVDEMKIDEKATALRRKKRKRKPARLQFINNRNEIFEWGTSSTTDENENKSRIQMRKDPQYALVPIKFDTSIPEYSLIRRPKE